MDNIELLGKRLTEFAATKATDNISSFYNLTFMNWFGAALSGASADGVNRAVEYYTSDAPSNLLPLIGRTESVSASASALVDCLSSAVQGYDDIHFGTTLHPAGPVAAAIMALARTRKVSGKEALEALRVGVEVEIRVAQAMFGANTGASGSWYTTGVAGCFGAAAAVGYILGFDAKQMENAFGIAAGRAAGNRGVHTVMTAYICPAFAAETGYAAARMTESGFTGTINALTGRNGLVKLVTPNANIDLALNGLGEKYVAEEASCKPYPYGFINHAVIRCCQDIRTNMDAKGKKVDQIKKINMYVSPNNANLGDVPRPANANQVQLSVTYVTSLILNDPIKAFVPVPDDFVIDEKIADFTKYVSVKGDESVGTNQARCVVEFEDGECIESRCDHCPGSPENMLSEADTHTKFMTLVSAARSEDYAKQLMAQFDHMQEMDDISVLLK